MKNAMLWNRTPQQMPTRYWLGIIVMQSRIWERLVLKEIGANSVIVQLQTASSSSLEFLTCTLDAGEWWALCSGHLTPDGRVFVTNWTAHYMVTRNSLNVVTKSNITAPAVNRIWGAQSIVGYCTELYYHHHHHHHLCGSRDISVGLETGSTG
jgi:hypothetical protein